MNEPILVLGAGGFIGANIFKTLRARGLDVYGTLSEVPCWRHKDLDRLHVGDLLDYHALVWLIKTIKPMTVINCAAYGAYSDQQATQLIYRTNFQLVQVLLAALPKHCMYIHAGTSSEYGMHCNNAHEESRLHPNSHYAVSKAMASIYLEHMGLFEKFPCINLRLFSVYGPWETATRLMPMLVREGLQGRLPPFVNPHVSRDFVYVDDVVEAFCTAAYLPPRFYGHVFNICSGKHTTLEELAYLAKDLFKIEAVPEYTRPATDWDHKFAWYGNPEYTTKHLPWQSHTTLTRGLMKMTESFKAEV